MKPVLTMLLMAASTASACNTGQCRVCQVRQACRVQQIIVQPPPVVQQLNMVSPAVFNAYQPQTQLIELQYRVAPAQLTAYNSPRQSDADCASMLQQFLLFRQQMALMQQSGASATTTTTKSSVTSVLRQSEPTHATALAQSCASCHSASVDKANKGINLALPYDEIPCEVRERALLLILAGKMPPDAPLGDEQTAKIISEIYKSIKEVPTEEKKNESSIVVEPVPTPAVSE